MGRFRERLAAFFFGRNGPDELSRLFWWASLIFLVLSTVIRLFVSVLAGYILYGVSLILFGVSLYRVLSKNVSKRREENSKYLLFRGKIKAFFMRQKNKKQFKDTYIYVKCPNCKNILRFRRIVGEHRAKCPCCHKDFDLNIR